MMNMRITSDNLLNLILSGILKKMRVEESGSTYDEGKEKARKGLREGGREAGREWGRWATGTVSYPRSDT